MVLIWISYMFLVNVCVIDCFLQITNKKQLGQKNEKINVLYQYLISSHYLWHNFLFIVALGIGNTLDLTRSKGKLFTALYFIRLVMTSLKSSIGLHDSIAWNFSITTSPFMYQLHSKVRLSCCSNICSFSHYANRKHLITITKKQITHWSIYSGSS